MVRILALLFSLLFLYGCGAQYTTVYKQPVQTGKKYEIILIPDFSKSESEFVPLDSVTLIPDMISDKLLETGRYKIIDRNSGPLTGDSDFLLVKGTVTGFIKGCKYCEMIFMGINDRGKGRTSVWVQLIDGKTGELITDFGAQGTAKKPGHGKSRYIRIVDIITEKINEIN
ncbi:MAG: hypothetical protein ACR2NW_02135 [Thermodesulfobacteriota bacterium]